MTGGAKGNLGMRYRKVLVFFGILILWSAGRLDGVVVANAAQLAAAVENANGGGDKEIILLDGTYTLDDMLMIRADGVTVRSQSGNRDAVTVRGRGMAGGVSHVFNVAGSHFTVKDMTIGWVANHAIQIQGNDNSSHILISNLHVVDTYEQMVKISTDPSNSNSSEDGLMENCLLEYSAGIGPQYYIGGIDGHRCKNWIVRGNTFKNISSPGGDTAEHAVHFWSGSQDTLVENNLIINCDRGIGFGLGERTHVRGIIRNNMIYHVSFDPGFADVGIGLENASNAEVYNNTVFMANDYPNAIEYRFSGTSGGIIKNNLCNRVIAARDGGVAEVDHNLTAAPADWFADISAGNLHLASWISQVVDQGVSLSGLTTDYDGDLRPQGAGVDIGADEYAISFPATITVTSPNGGEILRSRSMHPITWMTTGTIADVKIEYTIDGGTNWTTIIASTANRNFFAWRVPAADSSTGLVRVSEASTGIPSDVSDAVFTLVAERRIIGLSKTASHIPAWVTGPGGHEVLPGGKSIPFDNDKETNRRSTF
jgi:hypothetical protein